MTWGPLEKWQPWWSYEAYIKRPVKKGEVVTYYMTSRGLQSEIYLMYGPVDKAYKGKQHKIWVHGGIHDPLDLQITVDLKIGSIRIGGNVWPVYEYDTTYDRMPDRDIYIGFRSSNDISITTTSAEILEEWNKVWLWNVDAGK